MFSGHLRKIYEIEDTLYVVFTEVLTIWKLFLSSVIIIFWLFELIIQDKFQNLSDLDTILPHSALAVTFLMGQILKLKQLLW